MRSGSAAHDASRLLARRLLPALIALSAVLAVLRYVGQTRHLYGTAVGVLLMFAVSTVLTGVLVAWAVRAIQRLERQRAAAEAERDRLFEVSMDMLCVAGHDGYLKRVNPAFTKTLGYAADELTSKPFLDFVHPDDISATLDEMAKLETGATSFDFENRYRCADGSWRWLAWTGVPDATTGLIYAVARDVSAHKAHEHERERLLAVLEAQNDRLRRLDRVKDRLIASVSHELRTPIMSIAGFAEVLLDERVHDRDQRQRYLEVIHRNANRLGRVVSDLLFVSEVDAGRLPIEVADVDLDRLVSDAVASASLRAADQQVELVADCHGEHRIAGDEQRLGQLLDNLITNAVKFTPPEGRVTVRARLDDGSARLTVADTGIGIAEDELQQVFEPFFRASSGRETAEGSGLGLAIAKAIVDAHRGTLEVSSEVGKGTTVEVTLPVAAEVPAQA